jgi:hypothetical protein
LGGERKSWQVWFEQLNQKYPEKKLKTWRNFREYCARGYKEALHNYKLPEPRLSSEVQAAHEELEERIERSLSRPGARLTEVSNMPQRESM